MANRSSVWEVFIVRQASLFSPFNWAPPAESHCDGALHANARHTTGNVPGELNASYKSPSKTNSMTRLRRSKKLLTISLSVHFHFLQAKISLNKGLQLLATHVIYLVYIVKRPSWNRPLPPQAKSSQDVCGECFLSIFETFASPLSLT